MPGRKPPRFPAAATIVGGQGTFCPLCLQMASRPREPPPGSSGRRRESEAAPCRPPVRRQRPYGAAFPAFFPQLRRPSVLRRPRGPRATGRSACSSRRWGLSLAAQFFQTGADVVRQGPASGPKARCSPASSPCSMACGSVADRQTSATLALRCARGVTGAACTSTSAAWSYAP